MVIEMILRTGKSEIWRIIVMIEIVFNESAYGSLKTAQNYGKGKYQGGINGVFIYHADGKKPTEEEMEAYRRKAEEKERLAWERATPMGGNPADIYGFDLALSIGDISESQLGFKRKQTLEHLYIVNCQIVQEKLIKINEDLKIVRERAAKGEAIRIWYSNQPDEMCGLYWFMDQLNQWKVYDGEISIVKLPEWETDEEGNIVRKTGWGETAAEEWHRYLSLQNTVSPLFREYCIFIWKELQVENAPLRAVLNGQLVSVSEKIYDDFILREITAESEEFQEGKIVGQVISNYQLGISDAWIALRIEDMIRSGILEVVSVVTEDMSVYQRVLRKCT